MRVIVCLDDRDGVRFNGRRQSRDRAVVADILATTVGPLRMTADTATLFAEAAERVQISASPLTDAAAGDTCVLETAFLPDAAVEELVVYRWNRVYPADEYVNLPAARRLIAREEWAGFSHERITKEVWGLR